MHSRDAVIVTPANPLTIALHGPDLACSASYRDHRRLVTIEGTYNSSAGSDLELVDWVWFEITPNPVV